MRKLATIRKIDAIEAIENADAIEKAVIDGWQVVVKKGEFKEGETVVYFEIDSFIPYELAPYLCKDKIAEFEGVKGHRLRTVKLRGCLSQGLVLPVSILPGGKYTMGEDVTDILKIKKYEYEETDNSGLTRKTFPSFIPKTDQERIQNIHMKDYVGTYELTEKVDGSSCTIFKNNGELQVCSRNYNLLDGMNSCFGKILSGYKDMLQDLPENYALQGEVIGPKVNKNHYNMGSFGFYIFDIFDISKGSYLSSDERMEWLNDFNMGHSQKIHHAPVLGELCIEKNPDGSYNLDFYGSEATEGEFIQNLTELEVKNELLRYAEGKSVLNGNVEREGFVLKNVDDPDLSFKVISNRFLLKSEKKQDKEESCKSGFSPN